MSSSIFFCTLKNSFIKQWFFGVKLVEKKKQNPDKNIKIVNLTPNSDKTVCCMFQHKQLNHWKLGTCNVTVFKHFGGINMMINAQIESGISGTFIHACVSYIYTTHELHVQNIWYYDLWILIAIVWTTS